MKFKSTVHYPDQDNNLHVFHIDYDINDFGELEPTQEKFYDELFNDIPGFAFGKNQLLKRMNIENIIPLTREAMKKVYDIPEIKKAREHYLSDNNIEDKYIRRGEFGELILYHLLNTYFGADALISKLYFKDSNNMAAHGFDAVHVSSDNKTLWLGESKLYKDKNSAINELINDLSDHFNRDFFESEFTIITNRVHDDTEETDEFILELINPKTTVLKKLANIKIALFAGYDSSNISDRNDLTEEEFLSKMKEESNLLLNKLKKDKSKHPWADDLDIYLFLFPLKDKFGLVKDLHYKLKGAQQI